MRKKQKENRLANTAKLELQKTQQLAESNYIKGQLLKFTSNKLRQAVLDDLVSEINATQTEQHGSFEIAKNAIAELRKFNPRKADELEQLLVLKQGYENKRKF